MHNLKVSTWNTYIYRKICKNLCNRKKKLLNLYIDQQGCFNQAIYSSLHIKLLILMATIPWRKVSKTKLIQVLIFGNACSMEWDLNAGI